MDQYCYFCAEYLYVDNAVIKGGVNSAVFFPTEFGFTATNILK